MSNEALDFPGALCYFLVVRVFKSTWFSRFAGKENITDHELKEMVRQLEAGKADADLGGGVYKLRAARSGGGKPPQTLFAKGTG